MLNAKGRRVISGQTKIHFQDSNFRPNKAANNVFDSSF